MQTNFQDRIFSIAEAATYMRVGKSFVYKLIRDKKISPSRVGRRTLIKGAELERLTQPK